MTGRRGDKLERILSLAAGVALFAWFIFLIRGGLSSWFDADDLMNISYYWIRPWPALFKANLAFWSSYYRPGGGMFYRPLFALFAFHPLPFRIGVLVLLSLNFGLTAIVAWQLTGSRWATLVSLLLLINPAFAVAYFDTGTIYDILAFTFFWSAFALYVRLRREGRPLGWRGLAGVLCLFVGALDAKEISVTFPFAVAFYELCWHSPASCRPGKLWLWTWHEGRLACIGGLFDIVYILGKRSGADSLWQVSSYHPHFSVAAYFESQQHYLRELIYHPLTISSLQIALVLMAMLAVAIFSRRRCLPWSVGFIAVSILPLAFIPGRGGFAYLVPSIGWAVYVSGLLDWLLEKLVIWPVWLRATLQIFLLALMIAKMAPWQRKWIEMHGHAEHEMQARYLGYINQIHALIPAPRRGAHILLLSDAERRDDWDVYFLTRLYYGDPTMEVDRMTVLKERHVQVDPKNYDYVLDWVGNRFILVSHK